jgi:hypothetical protein
MQARARAGRSSTRPQSDHRLRRGVRRRARPSSHGPQAVLHRIDRSRQECHACCRGPHRARLTGAWRQEPRAGLPGCRRQRHGGRGDCRNAGDAPRPVVHRRIAFVPPPFDRRVLPREARRTAGRPEDRRSARRDHRHGGHHQPEAIRSRLRLHRRRAAAAGGSSRARRTPPRRTDRSPGATSYSRPCSPMSGTIGG